MSHSPALHPGWHERRATHRDYLRFRNLADLQELTQAWVGQIQDLGGGGSGEREAHSLARGLDPQIAQNVWMLGALGGDEKDFDALLDDTDPADVLGRLEHTVWAAQAYTLSRLRERVVDDERKALDALLEQTAWKLGRRTAESRWAGLPDDSRRDLRALHLALGDSPFGGPHLCLRSVATELSLELLACPHRSPYYEVIAAADPLCLLHAQWMRGFVYALNTRASIETRIEQPRCRQRWSLL